MNGTLANKRLSAPRGSSASRLCTSNTIVARRGKLAGVFTSTDACRLLADRLEGVTVGESDDEDGDEWAAP